MSTDLLAPPRPMPKRLLSLQPRPSPYASSKPQRPGSMKRAHSFCANTPNSTYALASTSTSYLTEDKKGLIAPKLERTLSSMGCDRSLGRLPLGETRENVSDWRGGTDGRCLYRLYLFILPLHPLDDLLSTRVRRQPSAIHRDPAAFHLLPLLVRLSSLLSHRASNM